MDDRTYSRFTCTDISTASRRCEFANVCISGFDDNYEIIYYVPPEFSEVHK